MSFALVRLDTLEAVPVVDDSLFVGSEERKVDLCLKGDCVAAVHGELAADAHGIKVEAFAPADVLVNGQSVQSALLFAGDRLTIGPFDFRVERMGSDSSSPVRQLPVTLYSGVAVTFDGADDETSVRLPSPPPAVAPVASHTSVAAPLPDSQWCVRLGTVELGPMPWSEVAGMLARGELQPTDEACCAGGSSWQAIADMTLPSRSQTSPQAVVVDSTAAASPVASVVPVEEPTAPVEQPAATGPVVAEPQYFIQRPSGEEGPLPRHAVQQFVSQGTLAADTPVRLEWSRRWSTAVDLGFAYPDSDSEPLSDDAVTADSESSDELAPAETVSSAVADPVVSQRGDIRWGLLAPFFYARSALYSLRSLSGKHLLLLVLAGSAIGYAGNVWMNRRARTALTGTVLLDDAPLGEVVVTFTGMQSGEVAAGVADGQGRFRILTLTGRLTPGMYRITVEPKAGHGTTVPHGKGKQLVPERYALLTTSDVTIDVTAGRTDYELLLSRLPGGPLAR